MKRINFYLSTKQVIKLRDLSVREDISMSEIVRNAIGKHLKKVEKESQKKGYCDDNIQCK